MELLKWFKTQILSIHIDKIHIHVMMSSSVRLRELEFINLRKKKKNSKSTI